MRKDIKAEIGAKIRQLRTAKGLTIEELAYLAGVHPAYLGEAERGKKNFSLLTLEKLAGALGIKLGGISSGEKTDYSRDKSVPAKLLSLVKDASPEEMEFIIKTAKFLLKNKKK